MDKELLEVLQQCARETGPHDPKADTTKTGGELLTAACLVIVLAIVLYQFL